jgi:diphthine methyl ester synthase
LIVCRFIIVYPSTMVFYIIGLGLGDPSDISIKALNAIKSCKEVYLEYYTSVMASTNQELE